MTKTKTCKFSFLSNTSFSLLRYPNPSKSIENEKRKCLNMSKECMRVNTHFQKRKCCE